MRILPPQPAVLPRHRARARPLATTALAITPAPMREGGRLRTNGSGRTVLRNVRLFALLLLIATAPLISGQAAVPAGLPLDGGDASRAEATAHIVASILAYSRWPSPPAPVRLCVIGPADHADNFASLTLPQGTRPRGTRVERRDLAPTAPSIPATCDAVYIGKLPLPTMRLVNATARGQAIVTIAENDPDCRSEAMFCLIQGPGALSFRINLDAISRSTVRIDPRVLRISRGY